MGNQDKTILCTDCLKNYISKNRFEKYGKCISCARRETMAKTSGRAYIKYKDLSSGEKMRLDKQREANNNWHKKVVAQRTKDKSIIDVNDTKSKVSPERVIVKFLNKFGYDNLSSFCVNCNDMYTKYMKYCNDTKFKLLSTVAFFKILVEEYKYTIGYKGKDRYLYKGMTEVEWSTFVDQIKLEANKDNKSQKEIDKNIVRSNTIYTPELIDEIKSMASEDISTKDLRKIFVNKYPDLNITEANFNNIVVRHNIPHIRKCRKFKNKSVVETETVNLVKTGIQETNTELNSKSDISLNESTLISNSATSLENKIMVKEFDEDGDPIRLQPIKQEVVSVLDEKFKKENARNQFNYTVDDYINMLEMFEYLAGNIDGLIKCRDAQFNIVNDYQFDIVHEMENELAEEGNTYLQDKMYVMRDYRRYMEIDYKALKQLRPILKLIKSVIHPSNPNNPDDPKSISGCLKALKQTISENAQPKFVPRVDVDMTKKYDWAMNKNSRYKKAVAQSAVQSEAHITETEQFLQNTLVDESIKLNKEEKYDLGKQLDDIDKQIKEDKPIAKSIPMQDKSIKANASLKSIKSNVKLTKEQLKAGFGVYRVSCRISGGGFGVFRPWYKDYSCVKSEIAMAFAQQEFAKMKAENGSLLFTEIECHKLNVV